MTNPSRRDSAARQVIAAARAIVTYQVGLPVGCVRMQHALTKLEPHESPLPTVFQEYLSETVGLPLGTDRLEWEPEALRVRDQQLEGINQRFRDSVFEASWQLINRFSGSRSSQSIGGNSGRDAV